MLIKVAYVEQREYVTEVEAASYADAEILVTKYIEEHPDLPEKKNSVCYIR